MYTLSSPRRRAVRLLLQILLLLVCLGMVVLARAQGTATLSSDQTDYAPGSTATLTGSGFQAGETVTLQVLHDPTGGDDATSPAHQPWTVAADSSGNFVTTWQVPADQDEVGATLKATADGQTSTLHAEVVFTDASLNSVAIGAQTGTTPTYGTSSSVTYTI